MNVNILSPGVPPAEISIRPYPAMPIDKIDGFRTEDVLSSMIPEIVVSTINDEKPDKYDRETLVEQYIDGLLSRCRLMGDTDKERVLVENWVTKKLHAKDETSRSALSVRGLVVVDDNNIITKSPVIDEGETIVGTAWYRVSRHDYPSISRMSYSEKIKEKKVKYTWDERTGKLKLADAIVVEDPAWVGKILVLEWTDKDRRVICRAFSEITKGSGGENKITEIEPVFSRCTKKIIECGTAYWSIASPRELCVNFYGQDDKKVSPNPTDVFVIERDDEDDICFISRFLRPSKLATKNKNKENGTRGIVRASEGPAALAPFWFPSSIEPPMPTISRLAPLPWNIYLEWDDPHNGKNLRIDAIKFEFEYRDKYPEIKKAIKSLVVPEDVLAKIANKSWAGINGEEKTWIGQWLGKSIVTLLEDNLTEYRELADFPQNEALLFSLIEPTVPFAGGDIPPAILRVTEVKRRAEKFEWRMRCCFIENYYKDDTGKSKKYEIRSDWTAMTNWFTPEALTPDWDRGYFMEIFDRRDRPQISVAVYYHAYRQEWAREEIENFRMGYDLVVRKKISDGPENMKKPDAMITERIITGKIENSGKYGLLYPVIEFVYVDDEVVSAQSCPDARYEYEYEIHQWRLNPANERKIVIGKGKVLKSGVNQKYRPDHTYELRGIETVATVSPWFEAK